MAKIRPNNFLDTVHEVFTDATKQGVLHLYAEGDSFTGRHINIGKRDLLHFGTTGYLGLEQDERLKRAAIGAIQRYGTQFPLSKTYVSHPLYRKLEERLGQMYENPVIITKNSTLGHMGVIPSSVADRDAIILDHQVHWSVQSAARTLKTRSVHLDMIRHNDLNMLEDKIRKLSSKHERIWYMADGVFSMYGDVSPVGEIMTLSNKYSQLHLYFDDVHGMSWVGRNGTGYVLDQLGELPQNVLLFGTLSKTFGASGSVLVCSNKKMYHKIKTFGGPLTFSAQLEPASVGAAIASADIHLSPEIYELQSDLLEHIDYFNGLLDSTDLPLVERNRSPVFYIGTGMPVTGYDFVNRLMKEGYFVNLGIFPAVPVKNTGVRITISRHNEKADIKGLVEAMEYHYPRALEANRTTNHKVRLAFKLPVQELGAEVLLVNGLKVEYRESISEIPQSEWDALLGSKGVFNWAGLQFLEIVFSGNERKEENWKFHYFIIRDLMDRPVLATFFTYALWKEDMLAPETVSKKMEEARLQQPYHMTAHVLAMGSLFTEGEHLYLDRSHPQWRGALIQLLQELEGLERKLEPAMIVLRDFEKDEKLDEFFHSRGFVQVAMPDSARIGNLVWEDEQDYVSRLSARSRAHFRKDIAAYQDRFLIQVLQELDESMSNLCFALYDQVRQYNLGLNTFAFPRKIVENMSDHPDWEFILLTLKGNYTENAKDLCVGAMFCYRTSDKGYVPAFVGMDYNHAHKHQVYRQLLFRTVERAGELGLNRIEFGLTAAFEKRKIGAVTVPKVAYIQARDNFSMELLDILESGR